MKNPELTNLSKEQLATLHDKQMRELQRLLLNGTEWDQTEALREQIRQISVTLYKKQNPRHFGTGHPAEQSSR